MISICVVTYNSLDFLKILYGSVKRNTKIAYEFVVHDNASTDGTREWLEQNNIKYTVGERNEGNPALNYAVQNAKYDYVFLPNPDTYLLPNWDVDLVKNIKLFEKQKIDKFLIGLRCIEPYGGNPEYVINYCGHTPETFDEQKLLSFAMKELTQHVKCDTIQYSYPNCVPKKLWLESGGMDFDYFPGWTCDVDVTARMYKNGCRNFKLLATPRVYHFINGTFRKLPKEVNANNGWDIFASKWGITVEEFRKRMRVKEKYDIVPDGVLDV